MYLPLRGISAARADDSLSIGVYYEVAALLISEDGFITLLFSLSFPISCDEEGGFGLPPPPPFLLLLIIKEEKRLPPPLPATVAAAA